MAEGASWVKACHSPVVPGTGIHAMALTPIVLWTVWWSWLNFIMLLVVVGLFVALEIKGRKPVWLVSRQRSRLRGHKVAARPYWYLRRRARIESYADLRPELAWTAAQAERPGLPSGATPRATTKSARKKA